MEERQRSPETSDLCFDSNFRIPFTGKLNFEFGNFSNCLSHSPETIDCLKNDCLTAFLSSDAQNDTETSSVDSTEYHNSGSTYFQRSDQEPTCNLEALALSIFNFHAKDATFRGDISGAEWWTQVVDSGDDIGFHWDKDYGLEGSRGINVYPHLATVTYLTDVGGPTIVVNSIGCLHSEDPYSGASENIIMSKPVVGKHIKFDGRLLHAAPSNLILGDINKNIVISSQSTKNASKNECPKNASQKNSSITNKRITFLVNIWLNHIPMQTKRFPVDLIEKFSVFSLASELSFFEEKLSNFPAFEKNQEFQKEKNYLKRKLGNVYVPSIEISSEIKKGTLDLHRWNFVNGGLRYCVSLPLPCKKRIIELTKKYDAFQFNYRNSDVDAVVDCLDDEKNNLSFSKLQRKREKKKNFWRPFHLKIKNIHY